MTRRRLIVQPQIILHGASQDLTDLTPAAEMFPNSKTLRRMTWFSVKYHFWVWNFDNEEPEAVSQSSGRAGSGEGSQITCSTSTPLHRALAHFLCYLSSFVCFLESIFVFLDAVAYLVLTHVSNSQQGSEAQRLTKIEAFSMAVACMLHSYWLTKSLFAIEHSRRF